MEYLKYREPEKETDKELEAFLAVATKPRPILDGFDNMILKIFHRCLNTSGMSLDLKYDKLKDQAKYYGLKKMETSELLDDILIGYKKDK